MQQLFCLHWLRSLHLSWVSLRDCGEATQANEAVTREILSFHWPNPVTELFCKNLRACLKEYKRLFKFDLFKYVKVQPLQGCCLISFIFRGLTPTVIQIKPILGFQQAKVRRTWIWITPGEENRNRGANKQAIWNPEVPACRRQGFNINLDSF